MNISKCKKYKRLLAALLTLLTLAMAVPADVLTVSAENTTEFLGGDGTEENPYLISNKTHLNNVRNYLDAHFKMVADIEFTEADFAENGAFYNDGQGWEPIGRNSYYPFTGVFDGDEHTVTGLYYRRTDSGTEYVGLFGCNGGLIKNLGMTDSNISIETHKRADKRISKTGSRCAPYGRYAI